MDFSLLNEIDAFASKENIEFWGFAPFPEKQNLLSSYLEALPPSLSFLRKESWRNPKIFLPWAKSAICFVFPYNSIRKNSREYVENGHFWISRYALFKDYHKVLKAKLKPLKNLFVKRGFEAKICVDSFPILERSLAVKAGLGFIGKNGLLINPKWGSYVFLAEIVTDIEIKSFKNIKKQDFCKNCQKCVSACPTKALKGDGSVNPSRCISSYNVEWKGELPENSPRFFGNLFGCDICQEVCPFNKKAPLTEDKDFAIKENIFAPTIDFFSKREDEIEEIIKETPLQRRGAHQIIINFKKIISENQTKREETEVSS